MTSVPSPDSLLIPIKGSNIFSLAYLYRTLQTVRENMLLLWMKGTNHDSSYVTFVSRKNTIARYSVSKWSIIEEVHHFNKIMKSAVWNFEGGYWTVPILPIAQSERKSKWNKPLAMIQAFLIPIAVICFDLWKAAL